MNDAGNVAQQSQQNVNEQVRVAAFLEEYSKRLQRDFVVNSVYLLSFALHSPATESRKGSSGSHCTSMALWRCSISTGRTMHRRSQMNLRALNVICTRKAWQKWHFVLCTETKTSVIESLPCEKSYSGFFIKCLHCESISIVGGASAVLITARRPALCAIGNHFVYRK